jgi:hypothetical protein
MPTGVVALDTPNDDGRSITVSWKSSPGEPAGTTYRVEVAESQAGPYYPGRQTSPALAAGPQGGAESPDGGKDASYTVAVDGYTETEMGIERVKPLKTGMTYFVRVASEDERGRAETSPVEVVPKGNFFDSSKANNLLITGVFSLIILAMIVVARRKPDLFVRRITGLEAVDEALGRATEMGKPVFFVPGLTSMGTISTIASVNILSRVGERAAEYGITLKVPNSDPIVMAVSQETVKEAYTRAGRPDAFAEDNIFFITSDQFSYAAAVQGMMVREKPAANFFLGYFYAESLLLAETGATTGAIQIAGTDSYTQLPFFITTCDYTLMGEELYAASAYLSREPKLLGSLKGQDMGKAILIIVLIAGGVASNFGIDWILKFFTAY